MAWDRHPYRDYWRRTEDVDPRFVEVHVADDIHGPEDLPDEVLDAIENGGE